MVPRTRPGDWPVGLFAPPLLPAAEPAAAAEAAPAGAGVNKPFVERVPDVPSRLRRFTEKVSIFVNSLLRSGSVVQTGPDSFEIDPAALGGSGLSGSFSSGTFGAG